MRVVQNPVLKFLRMMIRDDNYYYYYCCRLEQSGRRKYLSRKTSIRITLLFLKDLYGFDCHPAIKTLNKNIEFFCTRFRFVIKHDSAYAIFNAQIKFEEIILIWKNMNDIIFNIVFLEVLLHFCPLFFTVFFVSSKK